MKRRVAHVFVSMPVGGAEDFSIGVAERMPAGYEVVFVCLRSLGVVGEELHEAGQPVYLVPAACSKRWNPLRVWKLSRWLRRNRISIVHTQTYHSHIYAIPAAWLAGIGSVLHQQKTLEKMKTHRRWMMKLVVQLATRVATLSEKTRVDFIRQFGLADKKVAVIPNAIDTDLFQPATSPAPARSSLGLDVNAPLIGSIASLNAVKNHEATIQMVGMLKERGIPVKALIVGEGEQRAVLQKAIDAAGLSSQLQLAGRKRPIVPWLQSLDLLVLASHWEGQPMVLLQAISCHIPIVASRIEGNVAALGAEHPGLFSQGNLHDYADKAARMLTDPSLKQATLDFQAKNPPCNTTVAAAQLAKVYDAISSGVPKT